MFQSAKTPAAADSAQPQLNLGLILPHSIYNEREYNKAVAQTLTEIQKTKKFPFKFLQKFEFGHQQVHRIMMKVIPSPTGQCLSLKPRWQCDQIGRFLKALGDKYSFKSSPIFDDF